MHSVPWTSRPLPGYITTVVFQFEVSPWLRTRDRLFHWRDTPPWLLTSSLESRKRPRPSDVVIPAHYDFYLVFFLYLSKDYFKNKKGGQKKQLHILSFIFFCSTSP